MTFHVLTEAEYAWIMAAALTYRALVFWQWGLFGTQPYLMPIRSKRRLH